MIFTYSMFFLPWLPFLKEQSINCWADKLVNLLVLMHDIPDSDSTIENAQFAEHRNESLTGRTHFAQSWKIYRVTFLIFELTFLIYLPTLSGIESFRK